MFKIIRKRCIGFDILTGTGMTETKGHGMKGLSFQAEGRFPAGIYLIPQKRMPDACHMDADLVGPSGFQNAFYIGIIPETDKNTVMGNGVFAVWNHCHFFAVMGIPSYGSVYGSLFFFQTAVADGTVFPHDGMLL